MHNFWRLTRCIQGDVQMANGRDLYDRKENAERMMLLQGHFPSVQVHNCVLKLQFYERNNLQLYYITE